MGTLRLMGFCLSIGLHEVLNHLLGGGLTIISIYLTLVLLDILTGYVKALKKHNWLSSINLEGLLTKFVAFTTIIAAAAVDKVAPFLSVTLPVEVALIWTGLLCVYELGSILENASLMGVKVNWLMKWLQVFEEQVTEEKKVGKHNGK